jgi:hypothetical protein
MTFEDWYMETFGKPPFMMNAHPDLITEQCVMETVYNAALENNTPKTSTDFTVPKSNPYEDYLLFDTNKKSWFVGYYDPIHERFLWTPRKLNGDEYLEPSHWLPLPENP